MRTTLGFMALLLFTCSAFGLEQVYVALNPVDGVQRTAVYKQIKEFERAHPDIRVAVRVTEHETYKTAIENILKSKSDKVDIFFWFGGSKLRSFADNGWLQPISNLWRDNDWSKKFSAASRSSVTRKGEQFGLPLYYYQWGIYYRKSIFNKLSIKTPTNWNEFVLAGRTIRAAGYIPVTLGSKNNWPAAGWFDYLNLRLNGLAFHQDLLQGCQPFTDSRIQTVMEHWQQLIENNFFIRNHKDLSWKEALPYLYQGKAAMMLMGNFFTANIPEMLRKDIEFFPFPTIDPEIPLYEDAPIDVVAISNYGKNRGAARKLLKFLAGAESQSALAAEMKMIPPRTDAEISGDKYIQAGNDLLQQAEGLAQFFDRDSNPEFSELAMPLLVKFIENPHQIAETQEALEKVRAKIYGKNETCRK